MGEEWRRGRRGRREEELREYERVINPIQERINGDTRVVLERINRGIKVIEERN